MAVLSNGRQKSLEEVYRFFRATSTVGIPEFEGAAGREIRLEVFDFRLVRDKTVTFGFGAN